MSKRHEDEYCNEDRHEDKSCCCNFPSLVILILIILQFNRRREHGERKERSESVVDNSILFIIALFYLSCCNPCNKMRY